MAPAVSNSVEGIAVGVKQQPECVLQGYFVGLAYVSFSCIALGVHRPADTAYALALSSMAVALSRWIVGTIARHVDFDFWERA